MVTDRHRAQASNPYESAVRRQAGVPTTTTEQLNAVGPSQQDGARAAAAASARAGSNRLLGRPDFLLSPSLGKRSLLQGFGVKQKAPVVKQWITEIMVGRWQSGEATITFGVELFSWTTQREVPGVGYVTLKLRTSSITSAIFDKKSNVLKIRGFVEVPMDALDHWYDSFSKPGASLTATHLATRSGR